MITFKRTHLWLELQSRSSSNDRAEMIAAVLLPLLTSIERILKSSSTSQRDFTLHDEEHSFRVAQRVHEIIPSVTWNELSDCELALLLMSAYLHDIGMTPELKQVHSVNDYLLTRDKSVIGDTELEKLLEWLDENTHLQIAITNPLTGSTLQATRRAVALYCRYRHNDWSESWVRTNLDLKAIYPECLEDLITICRSHHEHRERLMSAAFDPRLIPPNGKAVHRRYLACALRIADILDLDPERTPAVIFSHRDIAVDSEIYWHKDQSVAISIENGVVHVYAEPTNAVIHKAVLETASGIEEELRLCNQVASEKPFDINAAVPAKRLAHKWNLQPFVHQRIIPHDGRYEFIDGSFRPNGNKVLQLLGSPGLYATPFAAVRELLQNAFDSVRERIARERLSLVGRDIDLAEIANRYEVALRLEQNGTDYALVCTDDGAGMNIGTIRDHFLVSGNSERPDLRRLARKCHESGFSLERTGQFGIGVLSYFLLAESVEIETRRATIAGDAEGHGWKFETHGVGTFGELRLYESIREGTSLTLRLKRSLRSDIVQWYHDLLAYLRKTLIRVPCRFSITANSSISNKGWTCPSGWTRGQDDLTALGLAWLDHGIYDTRSRLSRSLVTSSDHDRTVDHTSYLDRLRKNIADSISWRTSEDIEVEGIGKCRVHIPVFWLRDNDSPLFLNVNDSVSVLALQQLHLQNRERVIATGTISGMWFSWCGMSITIGDTRGVPDQIGPGIDYSIVELDCTSTEVGTLALDREWLQVPDNSDVWQLHASLKPHVVKFKMRIADEHKTSLLAPLWFSHDCESISKSVKPAWLSCVCESEIHPETRILSWQELQTPLTECVEWLPHNALAYQKRQLSEWVPVSYWCASSGRDLTIPWSPTNVALLSTYYPVAVIPIWDRCESKSECEFGDINRELERAYACRFPPEWPDLVLVQPPGKTWSIWNPSIRLTREIQREATKWARSRAENGWANAPDIQSILQETLDHNAKKAAILADCILHPKKWEALVDRYPNYARRIWDDLLGDRSKLQYVRQSSKSEQLITELYVFTPAGVGILRDLSSLPTPGKEWNVEAKL